MKILYLSKFSRSYATEHYVTHALREKGCSVTQQEIPSDFASCQRIALQHDVILFSKPTARYFPELLDWCKENRLLTVCWLWDLYMNYRPERPPQFNADLLFTTDGGHKDIWQKQYPQHKVLKQGIHEPEHVLLPNDTINHDVVFVGMVRSAYKSRVRLVKHLRYRYSDRFSVYQRTRGLHLNRALAKTKIVVGDSYPSPNYWSNRIYEMLGRGAFLLHPHTEGLDTEFTKGVHYVGFERGNFSDLDDKIKYYLHHPEERELIRRAGFDHCGERHTYGHRIIELLGAIKQKLPRSAGLVGPAPPAST